MPGVPCSRGRASTPHVPRPAGQAERPIDQPGGMTDHPTVDAVLIATTGSGIVWPVVAGTVTRCRTEQARLTADADAARIVAIQAVIGWHAPSGIRTAQDAAAVREALTNLDRTTVRYTVHRLERQH